MYILGLWLVWVGCYGFSGRWLDGTISGILERTETLKVRRRQNCLILSVKFNQIRPISSIFNLMAANTHLLFADANIDPAYLKHFLYVHHDYTPPGKNRSAQARFTEARAHAHPCFFCSCSYIHIQSRALVPHYLHNLGIEEIEQENIADSVRICISCCKKCNAWIDFY